MPLPPMRDHFANMNSTIRSTLLIFFVPVSSFSFTYCVQLIARGEDQMVVRTRNFTRKMQFILVAISLLLFLLQLEVLSLEPRYRPIPPKEFLRHSKLSLEKNPQITKVAFAASSSKRLTSSANNLSSTILPDPMSLSDMKSILLRNRAVLSSTKPKWSSAADQEILNVRRQLRNSVAIVDDEELHAAAFWNLSTFKRSYELMEKTLRVYIYEDGNKPIFHEPVLMGIYASEGWFMRLIRDKSKFAVDDPRKAHLFYMPFSSSTLRFSSYVPGPHGKRHLHQYVSGYVHNISAKYPFWNRTGGADHFFVACHDWVPYLTRRTMSRSIRVLCNSDASEGFLLGRDIALPQVNVVDTANPAGSPPFKQSTTPRPRRFLAFYAGRMHGYLRPTLVRHWRGRDPKMKIFGRMVCGVRCRRTYNLYMLRSKFCICPRGFQVYSPRVVEAILHGCVPVILSDHYVPPFFEVLDWSAFSLVVPEKDIPRLKDILSSISVARYEAMRVALERVRRHFVWNKEPERYDLFHMILHSVWFNRLNLIRPG